jgi:hypothetical protein
MGAISYTMDLKYFDQIEAVKKGRTYLGDIWKHKESGALMYIARRRLKNIYVNGQKTLSDALRKGVAEWTIESEFVMKLKRLNVQLVGFFVLNTKDVYLIRVSEISFKTAPKKTIGSDSKYAKAAVEKHHINLSHFRFLKGKKDTLIVK